MMHRRGFLLSSAAYAASSKLPTSQGPQFVVAMLTMLDSGGRLDDSLNRDYLKHLASGGADGVLVMGTTGEFASFSVAERKRALESTIKHRSSLGVMAQIATPNLPETLDLLDHAVKSGADSVLVLPPFYYKNRTAEGLAAFFEPILKASKLPVLLYNIPQYSGAAITPELLRKLSRHEHLYGIKDSFSDAPAMTALLRDFPTLRIMTGLHQNITANLKNKGAGGLTGNGSLFIKETTAIFQAYRVGADLAEPQQKLDGIAKALTGYDGVPAMKFLLSTMGLRESGVRPPFIPLNASARKELLAGLRRA